MWSKWIFKIYLLLLLNWIKELHVHLWRKFFWLWHGLTRISKNINVWLLQIYEDKKTIYNLTSAQHFFYQLFPFCILNIFVVGGWAKFSWTGAALKFCGCIWGTCCCWGWMNPWSIWFDCIWGWGGKAGCCMIGDANGCWFIGWRLPPIPPIIAPIFGGGLKASASLSPPSLFTHFLVDSSHKICKKLNQSNFSLEKRFLTYSWVFIIRQYHLVLRLHGQLAEDPTKPTTAGLSSVLR